MIPMHSDCRTALNPSPRAMTVSVASRGRAAIPCARRVGGGRGGASYRRAPVTASGSSKERSSSAVVGSDEEGAESGWGRTRLARTAVSLVASVAVLAPPPGAFTIETFRDGDDIASSSTRESRRHHPSSSESRVATDLHPISMSTTTNSTRTTVPIHRPPPTFIGARPARAFDLDPWKEGRARKAAQRAELQRRVDESYAREAENREEKERLQAAYYAKASASRKARVQALRDGATEEEANAIALDAGTRAFDTAVRAIDAEAEALEAYEARNAELRATAERRNAEALAAASAAEAVIAEEVRLGEECAAGVNPLDEPGSVMCT